MYVIKMQRTRSNKWCVCVVSSANGKLVLKGEPINRRVDAYKLAESLADALFSAEDRPYLIEELSWHHRWPLNAGPKRKA
jgi:hypothetical protein